MVRGTARCFLSFRIRRHYPLLRGRRTLRDGPYGVRPPKELQASVETDSVPLEDPGHGQPFDNERVIGDETLGVLL